MKKFLKWFLGITAVGAVVGLVVAYFCRDMGYEECEEDEDGEDEGFELDKDLKPAKDREYVPLKRGEEEVPEKKAEKEAAEPDKAEVEEKAEDENKPEETKSE